jgi:quercetin dioxygenase-like cupin family protein|tara:strand:- start:360 stop:629 length:270 start_codon:yes stop_codon:yes gene_type:complete
VAEIISGNPYDEEGDIRTFHSYVKTDELVWHRDNEDRKITVIEGEGWQFQFNGSLPMELRKDRMFEIPRDMYHRLIKGKTKLVLRIEKI